MWNQVYDPFGNATLSTIAAALPVVTLLGGLLPSLLSGAITTVRRWLWVDWVLTIPGHRDGFQKLEPGLRRILLNGLAQAA